MSSGLAYKPTPVFLQPLIIETAHPDESRDPAPRFRPAPEERIKMFHVKHSNPARKGGDKFSGHKLLLAVTGEGPRFTGSHVPNFTIWKELAVLG